MRKWFTLLLLQLGSTMVYAASQDVSMSSGKGLYSLAAALAIALAALGGALGQGKIGASAMEGISRNPGAQKSMFVSMILGFAFIESLVIFAFVVSFLLFGKI